MKEDIKQFWENLVSRTVVLRFSVTDKQKAIETLQSQLKDADLPGLEVKDIILVDQSERAKEFASDLSTLLDKYNDLF
jgi:hypothetical protein